MALPTLAKVPGSTVASVDTRVLELVAWYSFRDFVTRYKVRVLVYFIAIPGIAIPYQSHGYVHTHMHALVQPYGRVCSYTCTRVYVLEYVPAHVYVHVCSIRGASCHFN